MYYSQNMQISLIALKRPYGPQVQFPQGPWCHHVFKKLMCKRKYNKFCFAYLCQPFKLHHRTSNWIRVFGSIERDNKLTYFMFIRFVARNVLHFVKREATLASRESLFFTSSLTTYAIYTKKIVVNNYILDFQNLIYMYSRSSNNVLFRLQKSDSAKIVFTTMLQQAHVYS